MIKDEALKLALDYLESRGLAWNVQIALREALAQPEQEPVAWLSTDSIGERHLCFDKPLDNDPVQPLYTTPPQPEPVALPCCGYADASAVKWNPHNQVVQCHNCGQVYETPPQHTWIGLTDETISEIAINNPPMVHEFARAIEAKLKEKNT